MCVLHSVSFVINDYLVSFVILIQNFMLTFKNRGTQIDVIVIGSSMVVTV